MNELQDAIDRFTLALPLLDNPGEGAAQYRDDAQVIVEAARRVANAQPMYQQGGHWYLMDADDMNEPDGWLLGITTEDTDGD